MSGSDFTTSPATSAKSSEKTNRTIMVVVSFLMSQGLMSEGLMSEVEM